MSTISENMGKRRCGQCGKDNDHDKITVFDLSKTTFGGTFPFSFLCQDHFDEQHMTTYADGRKRFVKHNTLLFYLSVTTLYTQHINHFPLIVTNGSIDCKTVIKCIKFIQKKTQLSKDGLKLAK